MRHSEELAIITVNGRQQKLLARLRDLHLIKIHGATHMAYKLGGRECCQLAYISGPRFLTNWIYDHFNTGFMVSDDGPDRRDFNQAVEVLNRIWKEAGKDAPFPT